MEIRSLHGRGQLKVGSQLGKGGEGSVYSVVDHTVPNLPKDIVFKEYHDPSGREKKLIAMLKNPPKSKSLAWPLGVVYDDSGFFSGYVMKKLDSQSYRTWAEFSNTSDRRKASDKFDFRYALASSINLALAMKSVHQAGHCVGDVNESNIFISQTAGVLLVDTDSAQIRMGNDLYPCLVGKPEYVAPEISHGRFEDNPRTPQTDIYAYCVAVTQMLTGGAHPTDGAYTGDDDPPTTIERNRAGAYPVLRPTPNFKPVPRIPSECLPNYVKEILVRGLSVNPAERITLDNIVKVFDNVIKNLKQCSEFETHWFDARDHVSCPWCVRRDNGLIDPWGPPLSESTDNQFVMPSIGFNDDDDEAPIVQRSAITTGGNNQQMPPMNPQGYPQQQYPPMQGFQSAPQGYPPMGYPPAPPVQEEEEIPDMIKGKTVLKMKDGSWEVRPPLSELFSYAPKVALHCIRKEIPSVISPWWKIQRPLVNIVGLVIGLILGLALSASLFFVPQVIEFFYAGYNDLPVIITSTIIPYLSYAMIALGAFSVLFLAGSAIRDLLATRKQSKGHLENFSTDPLPKTILRFLPLPYFYGILGTLFGIFLVIYLIINAIVKDAKKQKYYY